MQQVESGMVVCCPKCGATASVSKIGIENFACRKCSGKVLEHGLSTDLLWSLKIMDLMEKMILGDFRNASKKYKCFMI